MKRPLVGFLIVMLLATAVPAQSPITALAFTPEGDRLLVGSQAGLEVYRWPQLEPTGTLTVELPHIHDLAFAPSGASLAVAGGRPGDYGELVLYAWPPERIVWRRVVHDDLIYRVAWNQAGDRLASAGADNKVVCLATDSGEVRATLQGHSRPVLAAAFLPDGTQLVTTGIDRSLRVWDPASATVLRELDNHTDQVRGLALRPTAAGLPCLASVGADRTVRFWQPTIGRMVRFARLAVEPLCLAWMADGQHVVIGCEDGHVRLVDFETLQVIGDRAVLDGWVYEVAPAPNGTKLAVGGSNHQLLALDIQELMKGR